MNRLMNPPFSIYLAMRYCSCMILYNHDHIELFQLFYENHTDKNNYETLTIIKKVCNAVLILLCYIMLFSMKLNFFIFRF